MHACFVRLLVAVATLALAPAASVLADQQGEDGERADSPKIVRLPAEAVVDRDYFAFGPIVEVSGTVNGDVYAAGGEVLVDGTINGDLLAAGGAVTITGTVAQDVRVAGGEVTIDGEVGQNVTIAGGTVELTNAAALQGSLVAAGGRLRVSAPVARDARLAAGSVMIADRITGNLHAAAASLRLTSTAAVAGDLTYWSGEIASIDSRAQIEGRVIRKELPEDFWPSPKDVAGALVGARLVLWLASLVSTLVLGLLFLRLYPNATRATVDQLGAQPLALFGLGVLAFLLVPVLAGLLAITVVGLPLALVLLAWYGLALYLGRIFVLQWLGERLLGLFGRQTGGRGAFVVGLVLYFLIALIPLIGGLVTALTLMFGLGATLYVKKTVYTAVRERSMV